MSRTIYLIAPGLGFESIFPLQLSTLAASLKKAGFACVGLDDRAHPGCVERAVKSVPFVDNRPSAAVIETSSRNVVESLRVAASFKDCGVPVILVGTAAATAPGELLDSGDAFAAVTGDPETVVPLLLDAQLTADCQPIPGARYRSASGVHIEAPARFTMDLADLTYDRDVFPVADYQGHPRHPEFRQTAIETSRGCTFKCTFCPVPCRYAGTWRGRPVDAVVDEMKQLFRERRITDFVFEDDQPLHDMTRFHDLMKSIRKNVPGISMAFSNGLRADMLDMETVGLMASAGTRDMSLGIESGAAGIRESLGRRVPRKHIANLINEAHRRKMLVTGYFMLAIPGETPRNLVETLEMANRLPFDYVHFMVYQPWRVTAGGPPGLYNHARTLAYMSSYINPLRLGGLARRGEIRITRVKSDVFRLIDWVRAGRTGGGTW